MKHYHLRPFISTYSIEADSFEDAQVLFMKLWENDEIVYFPDGNPIVEEKHDRCCNLCPPDEEELKKRKDQ
tara:strand:- start:2203 stop:2415 length:213 start_codon:yes stop_codon:yes gene_type:complete